MAGVRKSVTGKGVYPASQAKWLLHPLRRFIMSPKRMVGRLGLKPHERVLEIGPGPGWFSPEIARQVSQGRLTLFDIQAEMLALAAERLRGTGLSNFETVEGDATRLPFADGAFDAVVLVTVLGEIGDPGQALKEIARVLAPGGRVLVAEQLGDPDHVRRGALDTMRREAGLRVGRVEGSMLLYAALLER